MKDLHSKGELAACPSGADELLDTLASAALRFPRTILLAFEPYSGWFRSRFGPGERSQWLWSGYDLFYFLGPIEYGEGAGYMFSSFLRFFTIFIHFHFCFDKDII